MRRFSQLKWSLLTRWRGRSLAEGITSSALAASAADLHFGHGPVAANLAKDVQIRSSTPDYVVLVASGTHQAFGYTGHTIPTNKVRWAVFAKNIRALLRRGQDHGTGIVCLGSTLAHLIRGMKQTAADGRDEVVGEVPATRLWRAQVSWSLKSLFKPNLQCLLHNTMWCQQHSASGGCSWVLAGADLLHKQSIGHYYVL